MVGGDKQIRAVDPFVYFLVSLVLHIKRIISLHTVNNYLLWELNCKTVLVYCDFLNIVSASDFNSGFSDQMLDNYISHQFTIGVSFLIKSMDTFEVNTVRYNITVIRSCKYRICKLVHTYSPNPILNFTNFTKLDALLVPECDLLITSCQYEKFT